MPFTLPSDGSPLDLALRGFLLALGLALLLIALLARRQARTPHPVSPAHLFRLLAHWLDVSWLDHLLLARLARQQNLAAPAALLLSPHTLRHHARRYLAACWPVLRRAAARRLERLARRLEQQAAQDGLVPAS